ncbi:RT0821/Lpp0805 family surface protein [Bosea sp. (in: a-proteobacteria)]|uniref:RT0821/Lpp0805 family surface protein n=1 Tax=Bosea sp. (in: a-proteobacteria) TaxID=1871050 RepID=UPI002734C2C0|nr:RT0821/Lpp0805 family surface protein [Bosea sp. (in: a-proteobacteria)]MDP3411383.1 RT0821/Lpp0805 family surface protein [Bosea sp. (in: a-proteobacteria)]
MRRLAAVGASCLALLAAGCSVSFPILGLSSKAEDDVATTSSVLPARGTSKPGPLTALSSELGPEDQRRAEGAMAVALDPQGNGAAVSWDNPQSGLKGSFIPVGGPFLRSDEICRAFIAQVQTQSKPLKLQGTACRPSGGDWLVKDMEPWKGTT